MIRYELEKGLFSGTISTEGLDRAWNEMYQKYLGISSPNARDGILQDVHWSDGDFGYFPTYALGSAFAAQFMRRIRKRILWMDISLVPKPSSQRNRWCR